jgi:hypothetical protein
LQPMQPVSRGAAAPPPPPAAAAAAMEAQPHFDLGAAGHPYGLELEGTSTVCEAKLVALAAAEGPTISLQGKS